MIQATTTTTQPLGNCSYENLDIPEELTILNITMKLNGTTIYVGGTILLGCPESEQASFNCDAHFSMSGDISCF